MKLTFLFSIFFLVTACQNPAGNPELASQPYPMNMHVAQSVPIQVIRNGEHIKIVNSTADDYPTPTLWVNQRFSGQLPSLLAGDTMRINLWSLRDSFGERFNAGGIWRTDEPTPLIIAELQNPESAQLVGLIVVDQKD
jgi:hypothetical protein